jgi:hypothetical protein
VPEKWKNFLLFFKGASGFGFRRISRAFGMKKMARLEGLEPPTHGLENRCSIQLS